MGDEIERKWLVRKLPKDLENFPSVDFTQGYLQSVNPRLESRVRREGNQYFHTIKSLDEGVIRSEDPKEITEAEFNAIWKTVLHSLEKKRYKIPHFGLTIELDVFNGKLLGNYLAEVEFTSIERAEKFVAPNWFGKEVTEDSRYRNRSLAENGWPTN